MAAHCARVIDKFTTALISPFTIPNIQFSARWNLKYITVTYYCSPAKSTMKKNLPRNGINLLSKLFKLSEVNSILFKSVLLFEKKTANKMILQKTDFPNLVCTLSNGIDLNPHLTQTIPVLNLLIRLGPNHNKRVSIYVVVS